MWRTQEGQPPTFLPDRRGSRVILPYQMSWHSIRLEMPRRGIVDCSAISLRSTQQIWVSCFRVSNNSEGPFGIVRGVTAYQYVFERPELWTLFASGHLDTGRWTCGDRFIPWKCPPNSCRPNLPTLYKSHDERIPTCAMSVDSLTSSLYYGH